MDVTASTTEYFDFAAPDGRIVIQVRVDRHWDGASIRVTHSDTLGRQYPAGTEHELDTYLAWLEQAAKADGATLRLIEDAASALTSAAAVYDDAERDLIASINSTMDATTASLAAEVEQERDDAQQIVADGQGWNAYRQQVRRDFTKGRVHRLPPTPAELDRIRNARPNPDGTYTVTCRPGQTWRVLSALRDRLGGTPTYRGNTRIIAALTYRAEQLAGYLTQGCAA
jgi:hypothetical protein